MAVRLGRDSTSLLHYLAIVAGAAFYGGITVGGRYFAGIGWSLLEISLTGALFGALMLAPILIWQPRYRIRRSELLFFAAFGLAGAVLQITQFLGIVLGVPVALVALLLYTQPIWTVMLGRVWLGEPVTRPKVVAVALAIAGTAVLVDPFGAAARYSWVGLAAALIAGLCLALWVLFARVSALRGNEALSTSFGYLAGTATVLLLSIPVLQLLAPGNGMTRLDPSLWFDNWIEVGGYTLLAAVLPALLTMWGVRGVQASVAGVLLLLEPVSAALLAYALFGEPLTSRIWLGGALILAANWVLLSRRPWFRGGLLANGKPNDDSTGTT